MATFLAPSETEAKVAFQSLIPPRAPPYANSDMLNSSSGQGTVLGRVEETKMRKSMPLPSRGPKLV